MIKFANTEVYGIGAALRGMRNPMRSWDKGDTEGDVPGENDLALAKKLAKAGTDHRKFLRQIMVSVDITAPRYWWIEFDTYKVGIVANSESTMHTIHKRDFALDDFSYEHLTTSGKAFLVNIIETINEAIDVYVNWDEYAQNNEVEIGITKKDAWWQIIQLLPQSYNQMRTVTLNYEVLLNQYQARHDHKLDEWHKYCDWIESLPYFKELCLGGNEE